MSRKQSGSRGIPRPFLISHPLAVPAQVAVIKIFSRSQRTLPGSKLQTNGYVAPAVPLPAGGFRLARQPAHRAKQGPYVPE